MDKAINLAIHRVMTFDYVGHKLWRYVVWMDATMACVKIPAFNIVHTCPNLSKIIIDY
jgi:hypothetical protein